MNNEENRNTEIHLDVYSDRSELHLEEHVMVYMEGFQNAETQRRYELINSTLSDGFLDRKIEHLEDEDFEGLSDKNKALLRDLVEGITSEVGRALVGVAFLQLAIKAIVPEQSVRLHKGTTRRGSFSWVDGISMRTIDSSYITPFLRQYGLLNVNRYGVFMTRSLAENYPYSKLYKAEMRGPFNEWINIVDALEDNSMPANLGLSYLLALLKNRSDSFQDKADQAVALVAEHKGDTFEHIEEMLIRFFNETGYSARAFEVVMHGFMQALQELHLLGDYQLVPMSQMRSANKKHGNIGDIELIDGRIIVESWDAKYGKPYLRDELEELDDKILVSPGVKIAGFVVDRDPDRRNEIVNRVEEIASISGVDIKILSFEEWVKWQTGRLLPSQLNSVGYNWLLAVVESFGQKRTDIAPIDEPCEAWINDLIAILK